LGKLNTSSLSGYFRQGGLGSPLSVMFGATKQAMALQAGRLFGNYRVVRMIGEGAFGEVYLAENPHLERRVAVKVLRPLLAQDAELVRRFFNEARAASAIRHPSIIEVFDAGETPASARALRAAQHPDCDLAGTLVVRQPVIPWCPERHRWNSCRKSRRATA
jgi:serine/threonine protein kinase